MDGNSKTDVSNRREPGMFCGEAEQPQTFISETSYVKVVFHTDNFTDQVSGKLFFQKRQHIVLFIMFTARKAIKQYFILFHGIISPFPHSTLSRPRSLIVFMQLRREAKVFYCYGALLLCEKNESNLKPFFIISM